MSQVRLLVEVQLISLFSGLLFVLLKAHPIALLPLILYVGYRSLALLQHIDYRLLVLALAGFALFVDDIAQNAWGRDLEMITEHMGRVLFESFGLTGLELVTFFLVVWILLNEPLTQKFIWLRKGVLGVALIVFAYFLASFPSALVGLAKGGDLNSHFIQSRFLHLLPLWTLIGFFVLDHARVAYLFLAIIAVVMTLKSIQAVLIYLIYPADILDPEYLVDHYFSMFSVVTLVFVVCMFLFRLRPVFLKWFLALGSLPVFLAFVLNQRRTSFVAMAFAFFLLFMFFKTEWYRRYGFKVLVGMIAVMSFVAVTWYLPPPLSFVRVTVETLQEEELGGLPSYRQLENANLLSAIANAPILGLGTGQEMDEVFIMPDISFVYDRYLMIPHNLLLSAWAYGGLLGIFTLSLIFAMMISHSGRLLRLSNSPEIMTFGVCAFFFLIQYIVYTYGDLGLQIPRNQMFAGLFFGGACRLLADEALSKTSES